MACLIGGIILVGRQLNTSRRFMLHTLGGNREQSVKLFYYPEEVFIYLGEFINLRDIFSKDGKT